MRTAFSVLLFVLAGLLTPQVDGQQQPVQLDMAPKAFDDQYVGCTEKMEKIAPRLLEEDMHKNKIFCDQWEKAAKHWKQIKNTISYPSQFNDFHGTALVAYTGPIAIDFNRAVRNFNSNDDTFCFKGFHYYLTRALQLLRSSRCHTVYRGSKTRFSYSGTGNIRFGQFTSSSLDRNIALKYRGDSGTLFIINTCLGVHIEAFSLDIKEKEVLIPGYEVYQKVTVNNKFYFRYNTITLENPQAMTSNFNCLYSNFNGA
ncbi:T-cell ecto-ADP-ribosyltransferase 1-like, partial [Ochotona curzoniae]|uniref:T-cell ecto-ADP-ribosyltransferase 1-like n=1 Tax=Ochotona curzoniae TaxID=130825 RepID=UPI001B346DA9